MKSIFVFLLLVLACRLFAGERISDLPAATNVTSADLIPIVQDGVTKQATASLILPASKLDATNGAASTLSVAGLTVTGSINTTGSTSPLGVDTSNYRIHLRGSGGSMPINFRSNVIRFGADDGADTLSSITSGVDKDLTFVEYTRNNGDWDWMRISASSSAHTLNLGGGRGGGLGPTTVQIQTASSISATSRSTMATFDGANWRVSIGSSTTVAGAVLAVNSTTNASIPWPRQSTAQAAAYTQPQSGTWYDTSINRVGVYDGSTRRYLAEALYDANTVDIGSIANGGEGTGTVSVANAAVGDMVLVYPERMSAGVYTRGMVTSTGTVTVYVYNTSGGSYDPPSTLWRVIVLRK